jgi:hypothetical protein
MQPFMTLPSTPMLSVAEGQGRGLQMDALSQFWATLAAQGESTAMGVQPVVVTPTRELTNAEQAVAVAYAASLMSPNARSSLLPNLPSYSLPPTNGGITSTRRRTATSTVSGAATYTRSQFYCVVCLPSFDTLVVQGPKHARTGMCNHL